MDRLRQLKRGDTSPAYLIRYAGSCRKAGLGKEACSFGGRIRKLGYWQQEVKTQREKGGLVGFAKPKAYWRKKDLRWKECHEYAEIGSQVNLRYS